MYTHSLQVACDAGWHMYIVHAQAACVMRVCDHTPVNKLFKDFTRGSSHLAFVARKVAPPPVDATGRDNDPSEGVARTSSGSSDADTEFIGIVTLEDVRNQPSPPLISRFW